MTTEQAIRLLTEMRNNCLLKVVSQAYDDPKRGEKGEALQMAIEALEETIFCPDCRYRELAGERNLYKYCNYWHEYIMDDDFCSKARRKE